MDFNRLIGGESLVSFVVTFAVIVVICHKKTHVVCKMFTCFDLIKKCIYFTEKVLFILALCETHFNH